MSVAIPDLSACKSPDSHVYLHSRPFLCEQKSVQPRHLCNTHTHTPSKNHTSIYHSAQFRCWFYAWKVARRNKPYIYFSQLTESVSLSYIMRKQSDGFGSVFDQQNTNTHTHKRTYEASEMIFELCCNGELRCLAANSPLALHPRKQ